MKLDLKKILFLFSVFLILTGSNCYKNKTEKPGTLVTPPIPVEQNWPNFSECQFYKIRSLIINCHEKYKFFSQTIEDRKAIIASLCMQQAFSTVLGINFSPSLPPQGNAGDSGFRWWFRWGSIRKGTLPPSPLHPVEHAYYDLLNAFKRSLDANRLNICLGGNYSFDGPTIINTSLEMINLGSLDSETFIKCYREQLDLYGSKKACTFLTAPQSL